MADVSRGEIWIAELEPTRGHEQAGRRPVLIISHDRFNHSPSGLVFVVPITSKVRGIPYHVEINPPEGGITRRSFLLCEQTRSSAKDRLLRKLGEVSPITLAEVEHRLRLLLSL